MGLMKYARSRAPVVMVLFRIRYWWMDTTQGMQAQMALFVATLLAAVAQVVMLGLAVHVRPQMQHAVFAPWVIQLLIAVALAVISYALRPKPQSAPPTDVQAPSVEDGSATLEAYGDVWVKPWVMCQRVVGRIPIKSGGKK